MIRFGNDLFEGTPFLEGALHIPARMICLCKLLLVLFLFIYLGFYIAFNTVQAITHNGKVEGQRKPVHTVVQVSVMLLETSMILHSFGFGNK